MSAYGEYDHGLTLVVFLPRGCSLARAQVSMWPGTLRQEHRRAGGWLGGCVRVWFDGGVRELQGQRVGGAGATLWVLCPWSGRRFCVVTAVVALPGVDDSQEAEPWGARMALMLVRERGEGVRRARISGDNLAIVRYCAHQGRLLRPGTQALLGDALTNLCEGGWQVAWQAVRRRLNMAADAAATEGVFWAGRIRREEIREPRFVTRRHPALLEE